MKKVYIQPKGKDISIQEINTFYEKVGNNRLSDLILPSEIKNNWIKYVREKNKPHISVNKFASTPEGSHYIPRGQPKGDAAGIYGIFVKKSKLTPVVFTWVCLQPT